MKSAQEKPPLLSVHDGVPGQYILRVMDARYRNLVTGVIKLLPDAKNIVLVTPNLTQVFEVNGNGTAPEPEVESEIGQVEPELDAETIAAISKQEAIPLPNEEPEVVGETQQGTKVVRRRRRNLEDTAGHDEKCGRCNGAGQIRTLMEGGAPATTTCPVCKGQGTLRRYGNRR